ncbi:MAG: RidA family protein [Vampirovibrionales bacterium]|nr:RidA family protein [Vampirovibrionales bacterium]
MRQNICLNTSLETQIGFSRAVRVGNIIAVSGTAPILPNGNTAYPGNVYEQARHCLQLVIKAIQQAGATPENVIRTRIMLTDISRWQEAAPAHSEVFGAIQPACTFVEISRFIQPDWLVEIEADCVL